MFEDLENKLILDLSHTHFLLNIYFQKTIFPGLIKSIFFLSVSLDEWRQFAKKYQSEI